MSELKKKYIELMKYELREIIGSPLVLNLLDLYSKLFLNNSQPGYCEKCLKKYYQELKQYGMEKLDLQEQVKTRTCKPSWNGLLYIPTKARHFNSELLTDQQACEFLLDGHLRESHFEKLPDEWIAYKKELDKEQKSPEIKEQAKEEAKKPVKKTAKKTK